MATATELELLVKWDERGEYTRRREAVLGAGVLHLAFVIGVLISPKLFPFQVLAVAQAGVDEIPEYAIIYIPNPEAMPDLQPNTPDDLTEEESRRAVIRSPLAVDSEELRRMFGLPPTPTPEDPSQALALPTLPSPEETSGEGAGPGEGQEALGAESDAATEPLEPEEAQLRQQPILEDVPRPQQNSDSSLGIPLRSPGQAIEESLRQGAGTQGFSTPGGGYAGPAKPNLRATYPQILSDTRGVDFGPYLIRLLADVRRSWYAAIPASVRWGEQGRVVIVFTILEEGDVPRDHPEVVASSGRSPLDRPALAAIRGAQPFPPLPEEFTGDHIVMQFTFLYNLPVDYTGQ